MVSLEPEALSVFEIPEAADEGSVSYGIPISVLSQTDGHSLVTADWSPALVTHSCCQPVRIICLTERPSEERVELKGRGSIMSGWEDIILNSEPSV